MSPHAMRSAVQATAQPEPKKRTEARAEQQPEQAHAVEATPRHDTKHADAPAVHARFSAHPHTAPPQIAAHALQLKAANQRRSQPQLGPACSLHSQRSRENPRN